MAIRTAAAKVQATVEFITGVKSGEYGEYRSVLFRRSDLDGDGAKVWRSFQPHEVEIFCKGQTVFLVPTERKGKPTWDVEIPDEAPPAPITGHLSPEQKRAIASYVDGMGDLLKYCRDTAIAKLGDCDEETIRCSTASLFNAASRKFNL